MSEWINGRANLAHPYENNILIKSKKLGSKVKKKKGNSKSEYPKITSLNPSVHILLENNTFI